MKRLAEYNPDLKIIVLLREPSSRAISHYYHEVRNKREPLSMREALEKEDFRLKGEREKIVNNYSYVSFNHQRYSYKSRGLYAEQIKEIKKHFNDKNIMIIDSKNFFNKTQETVDDVLSFVIVPSRCF